LLLVQVSRLQPQFTVAVAEAAVINPQAQRETGGAVSLEAPVAVVRATWAQAGRAVLAILLSAVLVVATVEPLATVLALALAAVAQKTKHPVRGRTAPCL
jgi:hypothetical protein